MSRIAPPIAAERPLCSKSPRRAFTLVELMVVLVIVAMLASLTLAGLSGVRQRAKADKTRSTIRKIDSIIQPMYESYATRRVPATGINRVDRARERLRNLRLLMTVEMPDGWNDVSPTAPPLAVPNWARNSVYRRYEAYKTSLISFPNSQFNTPVPNQPPATYGTLFAPAETLMMIVSMGSYEPEAMEQFRQDEIGDIDRDGAREFSDGWGRPIMWIRWPASFNSPFIDRTQGDPLDVLRVTGPTGPPFNAPNDWVMTPLIYSAGPDEATNDPLGTANGYGIDTLPPSGVSWLTHPNAPNNFNSTCTSNDLGRATDAAAVTDNITNYDLLKK